MVHFRSPYFGDRRDKKNVGEQEPAVALVGWSEVVVWVSGIT